MRQARPETGSALPKTHGVAACRHKRYHSGVVQSASFTPAHTRELVQAKPVTVVCAETGGIDTAGTAAQHLVHLG